MTAMRREIGLFGGISVLAGIMIGSGIFYIGGIVLARCEMSSVSLFSFGLWAVSSRS